MPDRPMAKYSENIPSLFPSMYPYGYKWPTLPELHLKLFGKKVKEAHDAAVDVATCSKCFSELRRLGIIRVPRGRR
jgi:hypothetical protein